MKTQNSSANVVSKSENKNAASQQVKNTANTTRRVVETRDQWQVIFDYSVSLIAAYCRNQKPSDPRSGFGFGATAEQPHSRAYAKSLIWGFSTNKAGKVLKDLDDLAVKANREKIAIAILSDCKLVKGETKDIMVQLNKVEPKRERMIAESVLKELTKPTEPTTPKGGKVKVKVKSQPKAEKAAPKGGKATTKGGEKSAKAAAPKGSKAEEPKPYRLTAQQKKVAMQLYKQWVANSEVEDFDDDRTLLEVAEDVWEAMHAEPTAQQEEAMEAYLSELYRMEFDKVTFKHVTPKGVKAEGKKATTKGGKAAKK